MSDILDVLAKEVSVWVELVGCSGICTVEVLVDRNLKLSFS